MSLQSSHHFTCDPPREGVTCEATSPVAATITEAQRLAWEAKWHLDSVWGRDFGIHSAQCPQHVRPMDRVDWGSTA